MADIAPRGVSVPARYRTPVATVLSFVWPGLGQWFRDRPRLGVVYALPPALLAATIVVALLQFGPLGAALRLLNPTISLGLLALLLLTGFLRVMAIVDASRDAGPTARSTLGLVSLLVALVVLSHAWLGYNLWAFYRAGQVIYEPPQVAVAPTPGGGSSPGANGSGSPAPASVSPTPAPPLPGVEGRVTILFIGVDNTHGVETGLTDSLVLASFDPITGSNVLISLPRDTAHLPYYAGGTWQSRINSLMQAATRQPDQFPDGPLPTLVNEISYIVGIPIDYYARIDIGGFTQLIDSVGGVDVVLGNEIDDPTYLAY